MKRLFIALMSLSLLLYSCGNKKQDTSEQTGSEETIELDVASFVNKAGELVDSEVWISGTVTHVCKHGGQRLFITGEDTEETVRITTGEDIAEFDVELEGSLIEVKGIVKELIIDETYLAEWEAEVTEGTEKEHKGSADGLDEHQKEHAEEEEGGALAKIEQIREEIAASGKDHLSDYWIETIEFKVKED